MTDVIVVGAGPAGATAARTLALGGARVLMLDRAAFPRYKPCGGGLTFRALRRFPCLPEALARIDTHVVDRIVMEGPLGDAVTIDAGRPLVVMVRRVEFDDLLLSLAREAGAELAEGVEIVRASRGAGRVRLESRAGRIFEAPLVVAADGVHSVVARRLGFNHGWPRDSVALDMMEETPSGQLRALDERTLWVSFAYGSGHGYGYVFPKRGYVNVGVGFVVSSYRPEVAGRPYALHRAFVDAATGRGLLAGEPDRSRFTPYQVPVGGPLPVTARDGVFLAGDAGGFVNGFTAEGIYFAMISGDLAAQAILQGPSARLYHRLWRREIGAELRHSRFLGRLVTADHARLDRLVRGLRAFPELTMLLVDYTTGEISYGGAARRFVRRFPRLGARLALAYLLNKGRAGPAQARPASG